MNKSWAILDVAVALVLSAGAALTGCSPTSSDDGEEGPGVHMAELNADFSKLYLTTSDKDEVVVVDARSLGRDTSADALTNRAYVVSRDSSQLAVIDLRTLELVQRRDYPVLQRISVGKHPSHLSLSRDGRLLAVMDEEEGTGAVSLLTRRAMSRSSA